MVIVGCSVGGSCALEVAALVPERVKALVLVGTKAGHRPEPALRDAAVAILRERGVAGAWETCWAALFSAHADPSIVERARGIACAQRVDDLIRGVRVFHGRRDMELFARRWPGPLALIGGEHDRTPPPSRGAMLAAHAVRGTSHVIAACGHYVNLEQPAAFDAIVERVISDASA
jgi:pimeloyl-ACP methyl ester carboxylesterase